MRIESAGLIFFEEYLDMLLIDSIQFFIIMKDIVLMAALCLILKLDLNPIEVSLLLIQERDVVDQINCVLLGLKDVLFVDLLVEVLVIGLFAYHRLIFIAIDQRKLVLG